MQTIIEAMTMTTQTIQQEVTQQRELAKRKVSSWDVAREFSNMHLRAMPELVKGAFLSQYKDDRDQVQTKEQSKNMALWCIALQATIEQGNTSVAALSALFKQFADETLGRTWEAESLKRTARGYCDSMIAQGILAIKPEQVPYIDDAGETRFSRVWVLSTEFKQEVLEPVKEELQERSSMLCKPMKHQPQDWADASTGVGDDANMQLISNKNYKGDEVAQPVLDAVNKLQAVPFIVAPVMVKAAFNMIANRNAEISKEDLALYTEIMKYKKGAYHFPVTMDNRGRMYYRGGILSPQGNDFAKACFQFAEYVPLGEDGHEGIAIHTANVLGFDKLSIADRIDLLTSWYDSKTFDSITNTKTLLEKFPDASKFQGLVAITECKRLFEYMDNGAEISTKEWAKQFPEGEAPPIDPKQKTVFVYHDKKDFQSNLVCHMDGTCNGLQHMAAITGDRSTAEAVNCTAAELTDTPTDIYGLVATAAEELAEAKPVAALIAKYGRDMAKNPVMITGYGAGEETVKTNTANFLQKPKNEGSPKLGKECGQAYIEGISHVASAVYNLTNVIKLNMKSAIDEGREVFEWETADGFKVVTAYKDKEGNRVRAGGFASLVPALNAVVFDDVKTSGAMAPNFVHSIDSTHLRMVVNKAPYSLVTVHDSIGAHAGNYWATSKIVREEFANVHRYGALENLCENMDQFMPEFEGDYSANEALQAPYIFS
jgi:hypothetical protein